MNNARSCLTFWGTLAKKILRFLWKPLPEKFRTLRHILRQIYHWPKPCPIQPIIRLPYGAWTLFWPDVMGQNILRGNFEENELHFLERFLKPGMVVLDVGAHIGFYTLLAERHVGETGRVIAFEPSPRERQRLQWNLALNQCHKVQVEPFALGSYDGQANFFIVLGEETGCNSMRPPVVDDPISRITVSVMTLDSYLCQSQLSLVDLIKLDVEGAELAVLKGASRLLAAQPRPVVMCELVDVRTAPWNYRAQEIYKFLAQLRYIWFAVSQGGYLCLASIKDHYHENLIAIPEERLSVVKSWIKEE